MRSFYLSLIMAVSVACFAQIPPSPTRVERASYISSFLKPGDIGAEIGADGGSYSYHVLLQHKPSKLYLIDPWQIGVRDRLYQMVYDCFSPFENVELIRDKSENAVELFPDDYFDYVYIDSEHSYETVMRDLTNYLPKVKVGGYLLGDDCGLTSVSLAIDDFLEAHSGECQFVNDVHQGKYVGQYALRRY